MGDAYFIVYNTKLNQWQVWYSAVTVCRVPSFAGILEYVKDILYKSAIENRKELPRIISVDLDDKDRLARLDAIRKLAQGELESKLQQLQQNPT